MFFSFDGLDGVGKTTQITRFRDWLEQSGHEVVCCRDPGSTKIGEEIRGLLLGQRGAGMASTAEMLLYMAARAQLVEEIICPALKRGAVVISDRYLLANVVYQGHATTIGADTVRAVGKIATGGLFPDLTFLLDMPGEAASRRLDRPLDRIESRGAAFRETIREAFLEEARLDPERIVVIDAARGIEQVEAAIRAAARKVLDARSES